MAVTKEDILNLIQLQAQDLAIDSLQASIDKIPTQIQALRDGFEQEKSKLAQVKEKATRAQMAKKEKEISVGQKEEAIRKHGQELNQVKTNEAYRALLQEIDKAKADIGDLETAILTLMEEIDQAMREEKAAAAVIKENEAKMQQAIQMLEAEKTKISAEAEQKRTVRNTLSQGISAEMTKLYDNLRKRRQGLAIAPVKGTMCGACRITIMPQYLIELKRGTKLVACESCQRILYNPETVSKIPETTTSNAPNPTA